MSGLRETFIKRWIVERTDKAETRPEEQSEKVVGRIYGMKYSWRDPKYRNTQEENKMECASSVGLCKKQQQQKPQYPCHVKVWPQGRGGGRGEELQKEEERRRRRMLHWQLMPSQSQRSHQCQTQNIKSPLKVWFTGCDTRHLVLGEEWEKGSFIIRKVQFPAVREALKAMLWPTSGLTERTSDNSGLPAEEPYSRIRGIPI